MSFYFHFPTNPVSAPLSNNNIQFSAITIDNALLENRLAYSVGYILITGYKGKGQVKIKKEPVSGPNV